MKKRYTSGIYLIRNNITGRVYIGQSKNIENRNKNELYKNQINNDFINDLTIYGISAFSCSTLEKVHKYDKKLMNARERFYIALYNSRNKAFGYNKTRGNYKEIEDDKYKFDRYNSSLIDVQHRKIKCVETEEVFDSYKQACKVYGNEVFRSIYKRRVFGTPRTFILLDERSELNIIPDPYQKPSNCKIRVSFVVDDEYLAKHTFTYYQLLGSYCFNILREWVEDQEKKEKRRLKYAERKSISPK